VTWPVEPLSNVWSKLSREQFSAASLSGELHCDIAIGGGGIGGLSTALALARGGAEVTLLEAANIGEGATGRSNGQVIATLTRHDPNAILREYGQESGERFLSMLQGSADVLFNTVERYAIDCDGVREGWMQPAHTPGRANLAHQRARQWAERGSPARALDQKEVARLLGSQAYAGGWLHEGGGHVNPLALARGLARAARTEGVRVFEQSPVLSLRRSGRFWHLTTPTGTLRADRVVLATAAYTGDLWPGLKRVIMPVVSYQLATLPLDEDVAKGILPFNHAMSDSRMDLRYFRKDRDGRLIAGGALAFQYRARDRLASFVTGRLQEIFPDLA
jgi:glycine/D-amino acid oxidase-like deaminating enzyme